MSDTDGPPPAEPEQPAQTGRRTALSHISNWAMLAGLTGGYGMLAWISARFLYPARPSDRRWMFVTESKEMSIGDSLLYRGPSGETINITRKARGEGTGDFIALSSTCPHLGCQVFWEAHNDRFFCPCHNGVFDTTGKGVAGPPGDAGMSLPRYPLEVKQGLLFVEVPVPKETRTTDGKQPEGQVIQRVAGIHGPGHDPCLCPDQTRDRRGV